MILWTWGLWIDHEDINYVNGKVHTPEPTVRRPESVMFWNKKTTSSAGLVGAIGFSSRSKEPNKKNLSNQRRPAVIDVERKAVFQPPKSLQGRGVHWRILEEWHLPGIFSWAESQHLWGV